MPSLISSASLLLTCMAQANHVRSPFDHWLLQDVLPSDWVDAIANLPFDPPQEAVFDGRREANNSTRVYFNPANRARFAVCEQMAEQMAELFSDHYVIAGLQAITGARLSHGHLRIEYCQDVDGFWLEPHLDISVKLFTMLVYLSDDPALSDSGTDIYDDTPERKLVASAPYERNGGLIFIPGHNSWHGFSKRPIRGVRKSVIINYVSNSWRERQELCFFS
jgi:hypothetical protein